MGKGKADKVDLVEQARQLRLQAEALEKTVQMAKGTRDIRPDEPIGDETDTATLIEIVRQLITERPRTFQDLLLLTGARDNRIKGALMRLQHGGAVLVNLGTLQRAMWFLPSEEVLERLQRVKRATARRRPVS